MYSVDAIPASVACQANYGGLQGMGISIIIPQGVTCPPKTGPEVMLGFGPKTLDVFYGPLHPPHMPKMFLERDADTDVV